jgi:hypothetical protein
MTHPIPSRDPNTTPYPLVFFSSFEPIDPICPYFLRICTPSMEKTLINQ